MLRQSVVILAIVALVVQADVIGRRHPNWSSIKERELNQRRQQLDLPYERSFNEKRFFCLSAVQCEVGQSCVLYMCMGSTANNG